MMTRRSALFAATLGLFAIGGVGHVSAEETSTPQPKFVAEAYYGKGANRQPTMTKSIEYTATDFKAAQAKVPPAFRIAYPESRYTILVRPENSTDREKTQPAMNDNE